MVMFLIKIEVYFTGRSKFCEEREVQAGRHRLRCLQDKVLELSPAGHRSSQEKSAGT